MNTREKVLKEALNCVNGEREKQYGNPEDNFRRIADLWSVYLTSLFEGETVVIEIDPIDVAKMMILFKIARSNGDQDKLDNYVDIIGYGACAAEILEKDMEFNKKYQKEEWRGFVDKMAESRSCSKKASDNIREFFEQVAPGIYSDPYSRYHDQLAHYVSGRAKIKRISLDHLKNINCEFKRELEDLLDREATDCAINGKKMIECYKDIEKLLDKYTNKAEKPDSQKYLEAYGKIATYISVSSKESNISSFDIVDCLIKNGHAPTTMVNLLINDKISINDALSYVDEAINELNTFYDNRLRGAVFGKGTRKETK